MAVMPWGTVAVGMTTTCFSVRPWHCWAAMMMFLLLGSTNTTSLGVRFTSARMASVEGFMVWPPDTMVSTPRARKVSAMPSPAQTARKPIFFSAGAKVASASACISSSSSRSSALMVLRPAATSWAWMRMFSILATSRSPYFWASLRALPGMSVWTWTLKASSSSPMTRLSPMEVRYSRRGWRSTGPFLRTMNTVSKVKVMSSSLRASKSARVRLSEPFSSGMGSPLRQRSMPSKITR